MTAMNQLAKGKALRILACGFPGSGKTGALASLANAGYRLRILDFDGNQEPLYQFINQKFWKNVDIVSLEDPLAAAGAGPIGPKGTPKAFATALSMLTTEWKYKDGEIETNLGSVMSWTNKDVLVLDSLTEMGECAMRRVLAMNGRSTLNRRKQDWGVAAAEQDSLIQIVTQAKVPCHIYVTAHLKQLNTPETKEDEPEEAAEMRLKKAALFADKLFPTAIGQQLPTNIARHFPLTLMFDTTSKGSRVIRTVPTAGVDVKVPTIDLPPTLPLDTGLLTIFQKLTPKETPTNG